MPKITTKGKELARKLAPSIGMTQAILVTCSMICRAATTHKRLAEIDCNHGLTSRECERSDLAEARIKLLCLALPSVQGQNIRPKFSGDPRGYTVKLVMPDGRYDTWGGAEEGLGVPQ